MQDQEEKISKRALKASILTAIVTTLLFFGTHHNSWGWGFLVGAFCSLFSMITLTVVVPMLFRPGANPRVKGILSLTLFMKLPIWSFSLYLMTNVKGVEPMAGGLGVALGPGIITVFALRNVYREWAEGRLPQTTNSVEERLLAPTLQPQPVHEQG